MPAVNAHFPTDSDGWRSGIWTCGNGHIIESPAEPERECDHYEVGTCGEWTECVLAARYPREGEWGVIECGRCGAEFVEHNSERVGGWYCRECGGHILPRSTPVRFDESGDSEESDRTEQASLPGVETDGGESTLTETIDDTERDP